MTWGAYEKLRIIGGADIMQVGFRRGSCFVARMHHAIAIIETGKILEVVSGEI